MKISKERRKQLRKTFEKKNGEQYVKWMRNQDTYTPFEWVELKTTYSNLG